jgi:hypothetical protein
MCACWGWVMEESVKGADEWSGRGARRFVFMCALLISAGCVGWAGDAAAQSGGQGGGQGGGRAASKPEALEPVGDEVKATVTAPDAPLRIADRFWVTVQIERPSAYTILDAPMPFHGARLRLLDQRHSVEERPGDRVLETFEYQMQVMATGRFYFRPMTFSLEVGKAEDGAPIHKALRTPLASVKVASTLDGSPKDAEPRGAQGPLVILEPDPRPYYIGAGVLGALLLGLGLAYGWRRRRALAAAAGVAEAPRLPPWEEATGRLLALREANLAAEDVRLFHFELSDIMRDYLVRRYQLSAPELTSTELIQQLKAQPWVEGESGGALLARMEGLLLDCDLVKFARFNPPVEQALRGIIEADQLLEVTKPVELPQAPEAPLDGEPPTPGEAA